MVGWFPPPSAVEVQPTGAQRDWGTSLWQLRRSFALERLYWTVWPERYVATLIRSTASEGEKT